MNKKKVCLICDRIVMIKEKRNPYFVIELKTSYVVIGDYQLFRGYTLVLFKKHVAELHMLPIQTKKMFLAEMSIVGKAVFNCFQPKKMNYELLGNSENHLHWHLFPRHEDDLRPQGPVWCINKTIRYADMYRPTSSELKVMKQRLRAEIIKLNKNLV